VFPIRDTIRSYSFPIVNWAIIAVNTIVFLYQTNLGSGELEQLIRNYGMVAARLNLEDPTVWLADPFIPLTLVTSQFLHGGWLHLISNMWTLFIFGDNVEDRIGSFRFLLFYLFGGIVANLMQAFVSQESTIPAVGASGAIAAVLGAYLVLFPRARVITLIVIFFFPWFVEISAIFYLGFWFVTQLYSGVFAWGMPEGTQMGGIAWWAHIGGFLFGLLLIRLITPRRHPSKPRQYPDEYWPW
jgi:membrane associated rhomboid family serine protease